MNIPFERRLACGSRSSAGAEAPRALGERGVDEWEEANAFVSFIKRLSRGS
jgi:hypothetical protein